MEKTVRTYSAKERNMYLTGMFGQNMIYSLVSTGLYYYFQNVICLPAMALGWIMLVARIWDAINDPMMGSIVDKTKSKWGKCRPYLIFAPIAICVITILTFVNGNYATAKAEGNTTAMVFIVGWAAVSYIFWGMSFTAGDVPLWGIISRMSENEKDRSSLISLARIIASVGGGLIVASAVAGSQAINGILSKESNAQPGFIIFGVVVTLIATLLFICAGIGTKEKVPNVGEKKTMKESFKLMWKCVPFRKLLISGLLRSPWQLLNVVAMTLFSYYYCEGNLMNAFGDFKILIDIALVAGGMFVGQFVMMALCPKLITKYDIKKMYNWFSGLCAVPFVLIYVVYKIAPFDLAQIQWALVDCVLFLVAGGLFGAINVFQSVMISDCIDYEEYHTGYRPDGVFFSGQSFITKFSSGIASIISAVVYSVVGYSDTNISVMNEALAQGTAKFAVDYAQYADAMWFLVSIPPAIGMLLAVIPTLKYPITKEKHDEMLSALVERHAAEGAASEE